MAGYIEDDLRFYNHLDARSSVSCVEITHPATGVLDSQGRMIYRKTPPIGFGRDNEWYTPFAYE
jgi:hypothetical protein